MKIIYDFDGTLTPYPVPKFKILEKCGLNDEEYYLLFKKLKEEVLKNDLNLFEVFYKTFLDILKQNNIEPNEEELSYGAENVKYNDGLFDFLEYTKKLNIENYLLSSGMKSYLKNTKVAKYFKKIYGTTFKKVNDDYKIDYLMTDRNKVNIIKEITNGDCSGVIYIGDGLTDIPTFKYVKEHDGITILLGTDDNLKDRINKDNIVSFYTKPNYSKNGELFQYINNSK